MSEQNPLIDFYSEKWRKKCDEALKKCQELEQKKITLAEKWWRIKQLLQEITRPERRKKPRPRAGDIQPIVAQQVALERRGNDLHSSEWQNKCEKITEECAMLDELKIPGKEKLWRIKQLLKELAMVDKKRRKISR
ncbi:MAG TPA: hypothetical protein ENN23_10350 [Deltaproteobacteria bacterium]|nr:hypothetical protein [Deltaproteobacteria bacterium]